MTSMHQRQSTRRAARRALPASLAAAALGLVLAAVGDAETTSAVGSAMVMGSTVGTVTFLICRHVLGATVDDVPPPVVVSTTVPELDDDGGFAAVAPSRPDAFAVGWEAARADHATDETELQAWDQWMSTLDDEQTTVVWADASRTTAFDFSRWIPGAPDHDTVQLSVVDAAADTAAPPEPPRVAEPSPAAGIEAGGAAVSYPDFAPWPDAPWERANAS